MRDVHVGDAIDVASLERTVHYRTQRATIEPTDVQALAPTAGAPPDLRDAPANRRDRKTEGR